MAAAHRPSPAPSLPRTPPLPRSSPQRQPATPRRSHRTDIRSRTRSLSFWTATRRTRSNSGGPFTRARTRTWWRIRKISACGSASGVRGPWRPPAGSEGCEIDRVRFPTHPCTLPAALSHPQHHATGSSLFTNHSQVITQLSSNHRQIITQSPQVSSFRDCKERKSLRLDLDAKTGKGPRALRRESGAGKYDLIRRVSFSRDSAAPVVSAAPIDRACSIHQRGTSGGSGGSSHTQQTRDLQSPAQSFPNHCPIITHAPPPAASASTTATSRPAPPTPSRAWPAPTRSRRASCACSCRRPKARTLGFPQLLAPHRFAFSRCCVWKPCRLRRRFCALLRNSQLFLLVRLTQRNAHNPQPTTPQALRTWACTCSSRTPGRRSGSRCSRNPGGWCAAPRARSTRASRATAVVLGLLGD